MNREQEIASIAAALAELDVYGTDYSAEDIAMLTGLPINIIHRNAYRAGWREMGHQYSAVGYWELSD